MKRILLDTHVLIWWFNGDEKLGENAIQNIVNPENIIFVSAIKIHSTIIFYFIMA